MSFAAHLHSDIEIIYLKEGKTEALIGGERYNVEAGSYIVVFPNQIHQYFNSVDDFGLVTVITYGVLQDYSELFSSFVPACPIVKTDDKSIIETYELMFNDYGSFDKEVHKGILLAVMGMLLSKMELKSIGRESNSSIQAIISYCMENYSRDVDISQLSHDLHMSRSYISHIFSDKLMISFRNYINALRISKAQGLLKNTDASVTEVAEEAGFESVRTFNRAFIRHTGETPSQYRKIQKALPKQ